MSANRSPLNGKLIAFFHQSSDLYGSDKILLYLAAGVRDLGGHPVVILPDTGPLTVELAAQGIEFHTLPILKVTRSRFSIKGLVALTREARAAFPVYDRVFAGRRVDLVHSNTLAVLAGALWARQRGIPHLWHVHEIIEHPWIVSRAFPLLVRALADQVVCNSHATFEWLRASQSGLAAKMRVIWNGIMAPAHVDGEIVADLARLFRPAGVQIAVGLVGRINRWKGHRLLMDAVDILHAKGLTNFSLVFVGSPPTGQEHFEDELKARISVSPMRDRVFLRGFSSDVSTTYQALDIVCVPSTEPEPFGLVAVEAMEANKPVIAARFGGLTEIVVDGSTGLTFTPRDANSLAATLEQLIGDDTKRTRMGRAGRERFDAEFSVSRMVERFASAYTLTMAREK